MSFSSINRTLKINYAVLLRGVSVKKLKKIDKKVDEELKFLVELAIGMILMNSVFILHNAFTGQKPKAKKRPETKTTLKAS